MSWRTAPGAIPALLMLCLSDGMHPALAGNDHAVQVKIDQRVTVVPPGVLTRAMMSAVRQRSTLFVTLTSVNRWSPTYRI